jgi:hypothetical protein
VGDAILYGFAGIGMLATAIILGGLGWLMTQAASEE